MEVNLPTLCGIGRVNLMDKLAIGDNGVQLAENLVATLQDTRFLPLVYQGLYGSGIDEGSLHAYMLSALVLIGDRLGFSPVSDAPIFDRLDKLLMGEGAKRPDAVWFARGTQEIRCLVEFERYTSHSLLPKARNLLIMGKEIQPVPHLVVLNYWTYPPIPASALHETQAVFARGFRHASGILFPALPCPALVLETLVANKDGRARVHGFVPRLFVYNGEDKPYIIQRLGSILGGESQIR